MYEGDKQRCCDVDIMFQHSRCVCKELYRCVQFHPCFMLIETRVMNLDGELVLGAGTAL